MDAVWWLVSPQNPLKSADIMADYNERFSSAKNITRHNRNIFISDIEQKINTRYTYHTLSQLKKRYPNTKFIWLMGADNLSGFHRWQHWQRILELVPIVVFDRAPYSFVSLTSKTYIYMRKFLLNKNNTTKHDYQIPSLKFIRLKRNNTSSTAIRKSNNKKLF